MNDIELEPQNQARVETRTAGFSTEERNSDMYNESFQC